jgi:hypothetical protein
MASAVPPRRRRRSDRRIDTWATLVLSDALSHRFAKTISLCSVRLPLTQILHMLVVAAEPPTVLLALR